ncbi:MAG: hypothetical protein ACTJFY_12660, partial [Candidatus Corynebacterium faecigallinarum]
HLPSRQRNQPVSDHAADPFDQYNFLEPGEELVLTTGKLYEYEDGRTERSGGGEYGFTVDNLRTVDQLSAPDPDAPSDHPDSKAQKVGTYVCYDVTFRVITPTGERPDSSGIGDIEDFVLDEYAQSTKPRLTVNPIKGDYLGSQLSTNTKMAPPGSTAPFKQDGHRSYLSADGADNLQYNINDLTQARSTCALATEDGEPDLPDEVEGYVVGSEVNDSATPDQDIHGWRFDF